MNEYKVRGIVLKELPIGENDKRITLFTKEMGKVNAFAKGARKQKSKLLSGSQMFAYSDIILSQSGAYTLIKQIELIEFFYDIRTDIEKLACSMYIMELLEYVSVEQEAHEELLLLSLKTLKHIEKGYMPLKLIINIYEMKLLCLCGFTPEVNRCSICHQEATYYYFSTEAGGLVCQQCNRFKTKPILHKGSLYALRHIVESSISELYKFNVSEHVLEQMTQINKNFIKAHLEKRFKTMDFLKELGII